MYKGERVVCFPIKGTNCLRIVCAIQENKIAFSTQGWVFVIRQNSVHLCCSRFLIIYTHMHLYKKQEIRLCYKVKVQILDTDVFLCLQLIEDPFGHTRQMLGVPFSVSLCVHVGCAWHAVASLNCSP